MNNLLNLQQAFQERLLDKNNQNLQQLVVKTKKPNVTTRINIYADAYKIRLIDALSDNYSQLAKYTTNKAFTLIAKAYLAKYPTNFRQIQSFGNKLTNFLEESYPKKPVLAQLAKFEWAIGHTFDAVDQLTATVEDLKKIPAQNWPNMKFIFHPSITIDNFNYNVITLWNSLLNNNTKKAAKLKKPQTIIFWRNKLETFYRSPPPLEAEILKTAINHGSFAKICEILGQNTNENDAGEKAVTLLIQWLNAGLICQISITNNKK